MTIFIPDECPPYSTYDPLIDDKQPTCAEPNPEGQFEGEPGEGCICEEPYLLSNNKCVHKDQCGCIGQDGMPFDVSTHII